MVLWRMAKLFALFTGYHICTADFMVYIKKIHLGGGRGELLAGALLDAVLWQGTGATSAGKTGEGRWPGSKWVGWREKSLGKGLSGCVGRREQAPEEVMEGRWLFQGTAWTLWDWFDLEAVKPAGWQSRACRESVTCLAWGGLAGGHSSRSVAWFFST